MAVAPSRRAPTLEQYARAWIVRVRARLRPRTAYLYDFVLTAYLLPGLGAVPLARLGRSDIASHVIDPLLSRGLSVATVKSALLVLSALLGDALENEILDRNVALGIARKLRSRPVRPPTIYTAEQLGLFLDVAERQTPELAPLFALCARAGLRVGEAQGMRAEDLYLDRQQARVERTIRPGSKVGPTKSGRARVVDLPASCVRLLAHHHGRTGWCFPGQRKTMPVSYSTVRDTMRKLCAQAKLPVGAPHGLRHSMASGLVSGGVSMEYVRRALGHSSISTTQLYATHLPLARPTLLDTM